MSRHRSWAPAVSRVLGISCRVLITGGVLVLLFVAYQLWGTSIRAAQAQRSLEADLDARFEAAAAAGAIVSGPDAATTSTAPTPSAATVANLPPELVPSRGDEAGRLEIPAIGVDWTFVEGVSGHDLKKGPGHYPETPFPGQPGNAALAGHRTTYGQPFHDLDQLEPGDEVIATTIQGRFVYEVRETIVVRPDEVDVLGPDFWDFDGDPGSVENTITLTACHPKYSATERIVVAAELAGPAAPLTPRAEAREPGPIVPSEFDGDLSGERSGAWAAVAWALLAAGIWVAALAVGRFVPDARWPAYILAMLPFLVVLFFFFESLSSFLPANF